MVADDVNFPGMPGAKKLTLMFKVNGLYSPLVLKINRCAIEVSSMAVIKPPCT